MADFDAIVVGAGCAGSIAAHTLANGGKSVLMVERGVFAGAKNMTGGRLYSHSLKKVFPHFESEAPLERKVTHERIALMDASSHVAIDFTSAELAVASADSYTVLRAEFDQWLAAKAEEAGAEAIYGIPVEELLKDNAGKIIGIRAGEDTISADVTLVAEGVNSLLAERYLGVPTPQSNQMAVGVKEVYGLSAAQIEDRFLLPADEGAAALYLGCTHGSVGGGFIYTNKSSISIGMVLTIGQKKLDAPVYQMLADFKTHPAIAPILKDATLLEHSGHMVSEGGFCMVPELVFDGALILGDAAMLCMNLGYQVRGMDLAIESGRLAGTAALRALESGDTSKAGLASYKAALEDSFVLKDLKTFEKWPHIMENWQRLFTEYPAMAKDILNTLFIVDGTPQLPLRKRLMPLIKQRGYFKLANEMRGALKAL